MPCSMLMQNESMFMETNLVRASLFDTDMESPLLPGLPDDVAKYCLALVPRPYFPAMGAVCKKWEEYIKSKELIIVRKLAGLLEEWIYVLIMDSEMKESHWEVFDCNGQRCQSIPPTPGSMKTGFGITVLNGKLLVVAGYSVSEGNVSVSSDVYEYDCYLNSWSKRSSINVPRYDFACCEVKGKVYVAGGNGVNGDSLSSVEMYDPDTDKWILIESLRRPRWGCFGCSFQGKLYVMGGRSSFTIGNSKFVDIYNPEVDAWQELKNGCVMVTAHAVLGKKLFCLEWKNQRKLSVFNPDDNSWKLVPIPSTGSLAVAFQFGIIDGKLLLFSLVKGSGHRTLLYDPEASPGNEWQTSDIKLSGHLSCCVTIRA